MIPAEAVTVRRYDPATDEPFVYATWLNNYKHSSYFAKRIKHRIYFAGQTKLVTHLLSKPTTTVLIACPKDDADTMLGYLVCEMGENPVAHFAFVKDAFRKMGICKRLFSAAEITPANLTFTHWTITVDDLIRKYPEMVYNPYAL